METVIITAIIAFAAGVAGGSFFTWLGSETRLSLQENKHRQEHEALPAYERAALAYERAAERNHGLRHGPEEVEHYYRQAVRIRQEAEQDMLEGRTPLSRTHEGGKGKGGAHTAMQGLADYVRSRVADGPAPDRQPGGVPASDDDVEYLRKLHAARLLRRH